MIKIIKKSALLVVFAGLFFGATMQPHRGQEENKPWKESLQQAVDEDNWAMFDKLLNESPAMISDAGDVMEELLVKFIEENKNNSLFFGSVLAYVKEHALLNLNDKFINIPDCPEQYSLLHLAARYGRVYAIHALLSSGVDFQLQVDGETFLKIAIRAGQKDVVAYCLENRLTLSGDELLLAVLCNKVEIVAMLCEHGPVSINQVNEDGITPLMLALFNNFLDSAELLWRAGAQVNIASLRGMTALRIAVHVNNQLFVDRISACLLDIHRNGGEINAVDRPFIMELSQKSCTQHVV